MNLWKKYKNYLGMKSYEFSNGAKMVLFIFTIFLFYVVGYGTMMQTKEVERPNAVYGYECISVINRSKIDLDYLKYDLKTAIKYKIYDNTYKFGKSEECREIANLYKILVNTRAVKNDYSHYKRVLKKIAKINQEISKLRTEYNLMLLEKIAQQSGEKSILSSNAVEIKGLISAKKYSLKILGKQAKKLNDISDYREQQKLVHLVNLNGDKILKAKAKLERYYPLKRLGNILLFLIPLFFISLYIYTITHKKERFILARLFSSLLTVSGIFILFNLLHFIYQIMPKLFLERLIQFFMQLNLGFLLNYIVIGFFIILFGVVLWQIQIRAKNSKKLKLSKEKHIKQNRCPDCGCLKEKDFDFCPICGTKLWEECQHCNSKMIKESNFCQKCGLEKNKEW